MRVTFTKRLARATRLEWREVAARGVRFAARLAHARVSRLRDRVRSTYGALPEHAPPIVSRLSIPDEALRGQAESIRRSSAMAIAHRFDLLGAGPMIVANGASCSGLEGARYEAEPSRQPHDNATRFLRVVNPSNGTHAAHRWRLVDPDYVPIDWQLDFKSGFRWSERTWSKDVRFGDARGADVKVPWELARMQHLPLLAFAFALAREGEPGFERPDRYARELRNQILDFSATNPPRYGVNWVCTMDVAIRAANWLVAHDLLRAAGGALDEAFERIFWAAIRDHGEHVAANLEWFPDLRGNHYLADLAGLLFVASYLPGEPRARAWRDLAIAELVREVELQFGDDGACFEGSTSYHRLSAEMVVYATAMALGGPEPAAFPDWYVERLARMADFTRDCTKPDGHVAQIGDDDSGRFLKLDPTPCRSSKHVDPADAARCALDHSHLPAAIAALFSPEAEAVSSIDAAIVARMAGGRMLRRPPGERGVARSVRIGDGVAFDGALRGYATGVRRTEFAATAAAPGLRVGLELAGYPDFGLWIFRSPRLFLCVRCGPPGQRGNAGHSHNDQLALELTIDGTDLVRDPGSYVYTPLPDRRNEYRSVKAHFAPRVEGAEPGGLDAGLFRIEAPAAGEALYFGERGFAGLHRGYGEPVVRRVWILDDRIVVEDASTLPLADPLPPPRFSPAYGVLELDDEGAANSEARAGAVWRRFGEPTRST